MRLISLLVIVLSISSVYTQDSIYIRFVPKMLDENLLLDKAYFLNNDTITVSNLKFYISNLVAYHADSLVFELDKKHHLFDLSQVNTHHLTEKLPSNVRFDKIGFYIGVDSLTNVSGAIAGDLDPTNGMYWTWQSGYINFKLEGSATSCPSRLHRFQWHIGGYQSPVNTLKQIQLKLEQKKDVDIQVQIGDLLSKFDLSTTFQIMSPNRQAVEIANKLPEIFKASVDAE